MHNGYRILLVDDDIDLLMLMERRLVASGYVVEAAASLSEADELIYLFEPDLILLDINIKGEDGRAMCWRLKQAAVTQHIKIFIISGYDTNQARSSLFGADAFIPKPLNFDFLLHLIEQHRQIYEGERTPEEGDDGLLAED